MNSYPLSILVDQRLNKTLFIKHFQSTRNIKDLQFYSDNKIDEIIAEEQKYEEPIVAERMLKTYSSGERKKLYLNHLLNQKPDVIVLDNPLDHLDQDSRVRFTHQIEEVAQKVHLIQLTSRRADFLKFIQDRFTLDNNFNLLPYSEDEVVEEKTIDLDIGERSNLRQEELVRMKDISISYEGTPVVKNISWTIKSDDFWQLIGPNGSGKSSLLALITGDSTKGYGQKLYLFGNKKGSGESVWEIKQKIGYFAPTMTTLFDRNNTVLEMVLSGYYDSVGLYDKPTSQQIAHAEKWLKRVDLLSEKHKNFNTLSYGMQRMALILRAVIKSPALLILDEPTDGLDDASASLVINLITKLREYTRTAIVFVSHRVEKELKPKARLELVPATQGSSGKITFND